MSKEVAIGLIQMECGDDTDANLRKAVTGIEDCANKGAQIISLPELFRSKYFCQGPFKQEYFSLAEEVSGPMVQELRALAQKTKTVIICPLFEKKSEQEFYNSIVVIGTDGGIIGEPYRKMHIPSLPPGYYSEDKYFKKGDQKAGKLGVKVYDTPYGTIAPLICYDQWFPEHARIAASQGAQILLYPTAIGWPLNDSKEKQEKEHEGWQIIQRSHAVANNVFVAAVNRVGTEENMQFWGTSFVCDAFGKVLAKASVDKEENIVAACDLSMIEKVRTEWPFLDERRVRVEDLPPK